MTGALKAQNKLPLAAVVVANAIFFYGVVLSDSLVLSNWRPLLDNWTKLASAGLVLAITGVLNAQLASEAKARVVFLRWENPLPGSEAFTKYASQDPRIDQSELARRFGPLPTDPIAQNALWYKLYRSVADEPSVTQAHREYLFSRDYACFALMILIVLGPIGLFQIPSGLTAIAYVGLLCLQFLVAGRAARLHGRRLVTTVLALKTAEGTNCVR